MLPRRHVPNPARIEVEHRSDLVGRDASGCALRELGRKPFLGFQQVLMKQSKLFEQLLAHDTLKPGNLSVLNRTLGNCLSSKGSAPPSVSLIVLRLVSLVASGSA